MPDAIHALTMPEYQGSPPPPPQELLTTWGRSAALGLLPLTSVGARMNWAQVSRAEFEQEFVSHPLQAIHFAWGAMPIWLTPGSPSSPTIVPIVCVPWPTLSQGVFPFPPQTFDGSYQLKLWLKLPPPRLPRYCCTSAGWLYWTPVSMFDTTMFSPLSANALQTRGALTLVMLHPIASTCFACSARTGGMWNAPSARIASTSGRSAMSISRPSVAVTRIAFTTQNDL